MSRNREKKIQDKKENREAKNYLAESISLGMCFGVAIGAVIGALTDNFGIWMCLGISIGMCLGIAVGQQIKK